MSAGREWTSADAIVDHARHIVHGSRLEGNLSNMLRFTGNVACAAGNDDCDSACWASAGIAKTLFYENLLVRVFSIERPAFATLGLRRTAFAQ
jgi:hypothetical protein